MRYLTVQSQSRSVRPFAAVGPAARRYRSIATRSVLGSKCEQCPVVS